MKRFASSVGVPLPAIGSRALVQIRCSSRTVTVSIDELQKLQNDVSRMQSTIKNLMGTAAEVDERTRLAQLGYVNSDIITENGKTFLKPSVWNELSFEEKNDARGTSTKSFDWQKEILLRQGFVESDITSLGGRYGLTKEAWRSLSETQQSELRDKLSTRSKSASEIRSYQPTPQGPPSPEEAERRKNILRKLGFKDYDIHPVFGGLTPFKFKSLTNDEQKAILNAMKAPTIYEEIVEPRVRKPPPPMNVAQDIDDDHDTMQSSTASPNSDGEFTWQKTFLEERGIKPGQLSQNSQGGWWFSEEVLQGEMSSARIATWRKRMTDFAAKNDYQVSLPGEEDDDQEM